MTKSHFISRALISQTADIMEFDAMYQGVKGGKFGKAMTHTLCGAYDRYAKDNNIEDRDDALIAEMDKLVDAELKQRRQRRVRLIEARKAYQKQDAAEAREEMRCA